MRSLISKHYLWQKETVNLYLDRILFQVENSETECSIHSFNLVKEELQNW